MLKVKTLQKIKGYPPTKAGVKDMGGQYLPDQTWMVGHKSIPYKQYENILAKLQREEDPENGTKYDTLDAIKESCWGFSKIEGYEDMSLVDDNGVPVDSDVLEKEVQKRLDEVIATDVNVTFATWGSFRQRIGNQLDQSKPSR